MRKIFCTILSILLLITCCSPALYAAQNLSVGDLNGDGNVSLADVLLCARYAIGSLTPQPDVQNAADLNGTGTIELADVLILARAVLGTVDLAQTDIQILDSSSTVRLTEQPTYTADKTVRIEMAKNEGESAQFTLYSNYRTYQNVRVDISALTNQNGSVLPAEDVVLYREHFTQQAFWSAAESSDENADKTVAHTLLPMSDPDLNKTSTMAGENTVYQLDVTTHAQTEAGLYTGQITLGHDAGTITLPVCVTVWDFTLPQTPTWKSLYEYDPEQTAQYTQLTGPELEQVLCGAYDLAAKYKIAFSTLPQTVIGTYSEPEEYARQVSQYLQQTPTQTAFLIPFYQSSDSAGDPYLTEEDRQKNLRLYDALKQYGILDRAYLQVCADDESSFSADQELVNEFLAQTPYADQVRQLADITQVDQVQGTFGAWSMAANTMDFDRTKQIQTTTHNEFWWNGWSIESSIYNDASFVRLNGWFARQYGIVGRIHRLTNPYITSTPTPDAPSSDMSVTPYNIGSPCIVVQGRTNDGILQRNTVAPTLLLTAARDAVEDYDYLILLEQQVQQFLDQTGIPLTLDQAMQAYYSGLATTFEEFSTTQRPYGLTTMRRHIAQTILNGADYILTEQTFQQVHQLNQKQFTVYVRPGTAVEIPAAELVQTQKNAGYDCYTFRYTQTDAAEELTLHIGSQTYVRPIQMSLAYLDQPRELLLPDEQLLTDANPDTPLNLQITDNGEAQLEFSSAQDTILTLPDSSFSVEDVFAYTHLSMTVKSQTDCRFVVQFNTPRDSFRIIDQQLTASDPETICVSLPEVDRMKYCTAIRISVSQDAPEGTVTLSDIKLIKETPGSYAYQSNAQLLCSFGWEGDRYAPIAYIDGSYRLRDNQNIMVHFGVKDISAPIQWYNAEGYLPCFVSEYTKDGLDIKIENFANRHQINGNAFEIAYSRMTVTNHTASAQPLPQPSDSLIALNFPAQVIAPGQTIVRDYAIGADRFDGTYAYPQPEEIIACGGFDENYAQMRDYWNQRLSALTQLDLPDEQLVNAYKAGYIYTLIIRDDIDGQKRLHVGEVGYDDMWDHDTIGIVASLLTEGDFTYAKEYLETLPAQLQYDDAKWKYSWPYALYLSKTGDIAFIRERFDIIQTNTHFIQSDRIDNGTGILKQTNAIDSTGYWLTDNWSALAGLTTYQYLCDQLYQAYGQEIYLTESAWAKEQYASLLAAVEQAQQQMRQTYDYPYLSIDMYVPTEQSARSDPRDANWASMFLFGRWGWDGYLFGADQSGSDMIALIDDTYRHGFERRAEVSDSPYNFGGYPHGYYSSAYNAGYGSTALRGEAYRDAGIKGYQFMVQHAMSGPFGWWEGVDYPDENSPWAIEHARGGGGSCQHMWGQSTATKVLIDSLIAEKIEDKIIIGRGIPNEWLTAGQTVRVQNHVVEQGKKIGYTLRTSDDGKTITVHFTGDVTDLPLSVELMGFKNNIAAVIGAATVNEADGIVTAAPGTTEVTITLRQPIVSDSSGSQPHLLD